MGGHNAGDVASEMAVLQLGNSWRETSFSEVQTTKDWLRRAINKENKRIYDAASVFPDLGGMGTTLVLAAFLKETVVIGNIGDSRAYEYDGEQVRLITEDHSFANELRIQGQISEEEAMMHDKKNTLTRSLGVGMEVNVDFFERVKENLSYLLLCSDGLTNTVSDKEMTEILSSEDTLDEKSQRLVKAAIDNGGTDNVSICLVDIKAQTQEEATMKGGEANGNR
jgi:protein phosphatase